MWFIRKGNGVVAGMRRLSLNLKQPKQEQVNQHYFGQEKSLLMPLMIADTRWDDQLASLHNETEATHLLFHQFEPHLVAADAYNYLV